MKQVFFFFSFMFLCIGAKAQSQSLADKELERIASGELAEEISHCPKDTIHYLGVVVIEAATGNVVNKDGEFSRIPHGNTNDIVKYVMDRLVLNRLSKSPNTSSTEGQSIKHRDGWVHPAAR